MKNRKSSWVFKNIQLAETKNSIGKLEDRIEELSWKVEQRAKQWKLEANDQERKLSKTIQENSPELKNMSFQIERAH